MVSLLYPGPNCQTPAMAVCIEGSLAWLYRQRMASVSSESLAQAAESCRGSFYCCHVAPQNPVKLPIHPHCFCLSFFSVLMFFGCFLLVKLLCLCLLFSLPHGPKSCLPKAALFELSLGPGIVTAAVQSRKYPRMQMAPKLLIWPLMIFCAFHRGFFSSSFAAFLY